MKLRNLMCETMIACAFASCSNDDVPTPYQGGVEADGTTLALRFDQPLTKAGGDNEINHLAVLVFNGAGNKSIKLEKIGIAESNILSQSEVKQTKLTPGNKTVLVLANAKAEVAKFEEGTTTYEDVLAAETESYSSLTETVDPLLMGDLSMNSKAYEVTLKANVTNYLGYGLEGSDKNGNYLPQAGEKPVKLYRNVAKIVLKEVKVKEEVANGYQYPNATLKLKEIFILHGHNSSKLVGAEGAAWGTTNVVSSYVNGQISSVYNEYLKLVDETNKIFNYMEEQGYAYSAKLVQSFYSPSLEGGLPVVSVDEAYKPVSSEMNVFYTYENTSGEDGIQTLLVVKGDFSYDGIKEGDTDASRIEEKDRYYSFAIGNTGKVNETVPADFVGLRADDKIHGVMRNLQYNTTITVTGPGYKTPVGPKYDDTFLDVVVEVVPFGEVSQDVEI